MISLTRLIQKKYSSKSFRVTLHAGFWLAYWGISYYFNTISFNIFANTPLAWQEPVFTVLNLLIFYYPFMYFTWPLLVKRKKYLAGVLLLFLQVVLYTVIYKVAERELTNHCVSCQEILAGLPSRFKPGVNQPLMGAILSAFLSLGIFYVLIARLSPVIAIKIALDFTRERTAAIELEKENLLLEFNFLKSQVNPHFLFNTLNNIHSLVVQDQKQQASATVAKLSGFLRHSLYESGRDSILLTKEIRLLEDYIELEKLRLNKTRVIMQAGTDDAEVQLPPLLFIPLVENAFKYTADNLPVDSFIDISIVLKEGYLRFHGRNNYDPMKRNATGGIGLQNLRKRLQHYYPGSHTIEITDMSNIYDIKIGIRL
jgi:hypothetical protein